MEKMKKIDEAMTSVSYYANLFTLLSGGKNSFIITNEDIYREIENLNGSLGVETTPKNKFGIKNMFLKIFSKYITERAVDSARKRGGKEMYSLEVKPSDIVGMEIKILKDFPRLNRKFKNDKKSDKASVIEKKAPVVKESVKKSKPSGIGGNLPRRDWLFRFYELLKVANLEPGNKVSKKQIMTTMSISAIPSMNNLVDAWKKTLSRGGIYARFSIYKNLKNESELIISDCSGLIKSVGLVYKKWFGVDLKSDEVLKITTSIPVEKVIIQPKIKTELSFSVAYTIFAIGGICRKHESVVNYEVIYKLLKENFSIKISRNETIELVRKYASEFLEICNHGAGGVKLRNTINWDNFLEKFSPRNFKESTYARIGMTLDEVKKLIPNFEVEVVTEFTASDAVYRIEYDKSIHSLKSLCGLFRTFRGQDKFFDESLTKILKDEIVYVDSRSYAGNLSYEIEC